MSLIADRFLLAADTAQSALDLATGERVHVFVDPDPARSAIRARTEICDRLAPLRHPLLRPLVDYGLSGGAWFEAHQEGAAGRAPAKHVRRMGLHVVRFMRAAGIEMTSELAARSIRSVIEGPALSIRPIGVFLRARPAIETIRAVLEAGGPPGTTAIELDAPKGGGLHTARLQLARMARLAGYVVIDARISPERWVELEARHVCVLDWLPAARALPAALSAAAMRGGRRHVWIRMTRTPAAAQTMRLEPMMNDEVVAAIYLDAQLGPSAADVRAAAFDARGWPGLAIDALRGRPCAKGAASVHERAPEYGVPALNEDARATPLFGRGGMARLERAVGAARALSGRGRHQRAIRVLSRCVPALAARGAFERAAVA